MAMPPPLAGVVCLAAASRLLVLALSLLARLLFRPYDTSASLQPSCLRSPSPLSSPFTNLSAAISSLAVWDGVHFARAAECGYEYEQSFAFLPLLPASVALLTRSLFAPLVPVLGYRAVLVISGYVLNNIAFVAAAAYFYRLSVLILKDQKAAYRASVLFCFNPASVFYSSLYSESLYALFSLGGVFYLFSGANTVAMIMLALSGSARSNGALNAGYFCFQALLQTYDSVIQKKRPLGSWFLEILSSEAAAQLSFGFTYVATVLKSEHSAGPTNKAQGQPEVKQRKSAAAEMVSASVSDSRNLIGNLSECSILYLPFVLHLAFMTVMAFFVMHVQVSTRFLSASPPIYWAASHILGSPSHSSKRWSNLIYAYFTAYILLGSLLFSNFYPFT
ncbi:hypothetical protein PR202_ga30039 [Eleusine coracana subsp. coracana]|uniref:GPI mannosyltransferase 2 n=1 Tax=Eleusine coracana subsp. coracana TaxID=191504 RepID=A0AAV5DMD7_ELECO|nr:hypothetical protein PR202_ga30039 [Eleusine coracana subsp. coracana]